MKKLPVQVVSDIHLNWRVDVPFNRYLKPLAPFLFICGDTSELGTDTNFKRYQYLLEYVNDRWDKTFIVLGNHDYWTAMQKRINTMDYIADKVETIIDRYDNVVFLSNTTYRLEYNDKCYLIFGSTLWYDKPADKDKAKFIETNMVDYEMCFVRDETRKSCARRMRITDTASYFKYTVKQIERYKAEAQRIGASLIVCTHHSPILTEDSPKSTDTPKERERKVFEAAYASDLRYLMGKPLIAFLFGHTHQHIVKKINGTVVCTNAIGYPRERTNYDPTMVLEL